MTNLPQFISIFKLGSAYSKRWPLDKRLAAVFPEPAIIKITTIAMRVMPPFVCITLMAQLLLGGSLLPAIATALFAFSLPFQGLYWLGKRASQPLPLTLMKWYYAILQQLTEVDKCPSLTIETVPTYFDLAKLIRDAVDIWGEEWLDQF